MKFRVIINLENWSEKDSKIHNDIYSLNNIEIVSGTPLEYDNLTIQWDSVNSYYVFILKQGNVEIARYHGIDVIENMGGSLGIDCEPSYSFIADALELQNAYVINIANEVSGVTNILTYKLNDENVSLNKTLTTIGYITGNFNNVIAMKNLLLDIKYENSGFNYLYIPVFKRYYYVDSIEMLSANYIRLHLHEDVLMSWKDLIKQQTAFITRYGGVNYGFELYDERYPVTDLPEITYITPTMTSGSSIVNFKYLMPTLPNSTIKAPNVLVQSVSEITTIIPDDTNDIDAPSGSGLPSIQSRRYGHNYLMNIADYKRIISACINQDAPSTYIHSMLLLPFDLRDVFTDANSRSYHIYAGNKQLLYTGWDNPASGDQPVVWETKKGGSNYIVVADFTFNNSDGGLPIAPMFYDFTPNTLWEIYIPFVGWVEIDAKKVYDKRILIYFTFDTDTGLSTCYIYNRTDQKVIWSGQCQLGIPLSLASSNREELAREKQATGLNLIMGVMSGALGMRFASTPEKGIQAGVGILKDAVSSVNKFRSMFERASITYGGSDNTLYSTNSIVIRKTTHKPLITSSTLEDRYKHINGYPYRNYKLISELTTGNYIEVGEIHFNAKNELIYQDEIDEIIGLLKNGVII